MQQGNVKCLRDALNNVGITGTRKAIANTTGSLKQLFENMLTLDLKAAKQMDKLTPRDGKKAAQVLCDLFNLKSDLGNKYVAEHKRC